MILIAVKGSLLINSNKMLIKALYLHLNTKEVSILMLILAQVFSAVGTATLAQPHFHRPLTIVM